MRYLLHFASEKQHIFNHKKFKISYKNLQQLAEFDTELTPAVNPRERRRNTTFKITILKTIFD